MNPDPERRWRLHPQAVLSWAEYSDAVLVYNGFSGQTHLLDETAARVLTLLAQSPASAVALAAHLGEETGVVAQIARLLEEFDHLGLAEPLT